jgi:hypothetical protein
MPVHPADARYIEHKPIWIKHTLTTVKNPGNCEDCGAEFEDKFGNYHCTRCSTDSPNIFTRYSGRKKKVVTSVTFQSCPAGPTVKLLHDRYTKQSTTFQFLKRLQIFAARINHTTVGIIGVLFIYFYPCNQRFSKLFNSKKY